MFVCSLAVLSSAHPAGAVEPVTVESSFTRDVATILHAKCFVCHGPDKQRGGYRLDSFEFMLRAGDSGVEPVVAGQPEKSGLFDLITTHDEESRMPQKDAPLSAEHIESIRRWIIAGAKFDGPDPAAPLALIMPRPVQPMPPEVYPHPLPLRALAVSADGGEVFVGGYHEVTVWSASEGRLRRRLNNLPERISALGLSADGALLAVAGGSPGRSGEALLVTSDTGKIHTLLARSGDVPLALALNPARDRLAIGFADGVIQVFVLPDGRRMLSFQQHADAIVDLAFSPDGTRLASASRDRSGRVFDAVSGELHSTYQEHGAPVLAVAFSPDGLQVVSAGRDRKIHLWKTDDAKKVAQISGLGGETQVLRVIREEILSGGAQGLIRRHSLKDHQLLGTLGEAGSPVLSLVHSVEQDRILAGRHDGSLLFLHRLGSEPLEILLPAPGK